MSSLEQDVTEKSTEVTPGSTGEVTEEDLLCLSESDGNEGDALLDGSNATMVPETHSDDDREFDLELPTKMELVDQATSAKYVVIESENSDANYGKSEKKVPTKPTTENTDSVMVEKPLVIKKTLVVERENIEVETVIRLHDEEFMKYLCRITMMTKSQFNYLPEGPILSKMGIRSGLLVNLTSMANFYLCGATYQTPMIRMLSKGIDDFGPLKLQYCENSCLLMNRGYPVGIKIPTEMEIEWLSSPSEEDKTTIELAMSCDKLNNWGMVTIPNPNRYPNHTLYFVGHLDSNNILQDIEQVLPWVTEMLTESFSQLGGDKPTVVMKPLQEVNTLMDTETTTEALKNDESVLDQLAVVGVKSIDDAEKGMTSEVLDNPQLDSRGAKDRLHKDDVYKYKGDEKFNPNELQVRL